MTKTRNIPSDTLQVIVYLNKKGCLHYTLEKLKSLTEGTLVNPSIQPIQRPIIYCHPINVSLFSNIRDTNSGHIATTSSNHQRKYEVVPYASPHNILSYISRSIDHAIKITAQLNQLYKKHPKLSLYFPAFHPYNVIFVRWANRNNIPITITIHDYITHPGEKSRLTESLQKQTIKMASKVIFLTQYVKAQALKDFGPTKNFIVEKHPLIPSTTINRLAYNPNPSLLFIGRTSAYKGLGLLLEAVQHLSISKLTVVGGLPTSLRQHPYLNQHQTDRTNISIQGGYISDTRLAELMASHNILILPYTEASQSGLITLGISSEMVMVITKVGGLEEQLGKAAGVWVKPTAMALESGIRSLIESSKLYNEAKKNIVEWKKNYNGS